MLHVVLTSYRRLAHKYGLAGLRRVQADCAVLVRARAKRGLASRVLVAERGLPAWDVAPADPGDPLELRRQLLKVAAAAEARQQPLASLLIVGGPDIIPFYPYANPLDDPDALVPGDFLYGGGSWHPPRTAWPVGRLPDGSARDPRLLRRLLRIAARYHRAPPPLSPAVVAVSGAGLAQATQATGAGLALQPLLAPPHDATTLSSQLLMEAGCLYFNLRGIANSPAWYGDAAGSPDVTPVAVTPQLLDGLRLRGAVLSTAGYGAVSPVSAPERGLALRFLLAGAPCFVGATTLVYGSPTAVLAGSDLLVYNLLHAMRRPGYRVGEAWQLAREQTLVALERQPYGRDPVDLKALVQFVLYGDPSLSVGVTEV